MSSLKPTRPLALGQPRNGNLGALAADRLRLAIIRGELGAGQALREAELCKSFGISRVPLREALHQLLGEGLVEIRPNRGSVVASMSPQEVIQIAEICALLETHLLRQAIPSQEEELLDRAETVVEKMDRTEDVIDWFRLNWRFHALLYQPAERPLAIEQVRSLRARADRYIYVLARDPLRRQELNREHRAILAACRARSVELGASLLGQHLINGKDRVLQLIAEPG